MSRDLQFLAVALGVRALAEASLERPPFQPADPPPEDRGSAAARIALRVVAQARQRGQQAAPEPTEA